MPEHLKSKSIVKIENKGKWEVYVIKGNIKIGCKEKSKTEWKEFFKNKEYVKTNPEKHPNGYKAIQEDFKEAIRVQKKLFIK